MTWRRMVTAPGGVSTERITRGAVLPLLAFVFVSAATYRFGFPVLALLSSVPLGILLVVSLHKWPGMGFFLVAVLIAVAWDAPTSPALVSFGGVNLFPEDIIASLLLASSLGPSQSGRIVKFSAPSIFCVTVVLGLLMTSLVRGMISFGPAAAINEGRAFFYIVAVLVWFHRASSNPRFERSLRNFFAYGSVAIIGVGIVHAVMYGIGSADSFVQIRNGELQTGRPLVALQAMFIALVFVQLLLNRATRPIVTVLLGSIVLIAQHRSVWVATIAGVFAMSVIATARNRSRVVVLAVCAAGAALIATLVGALGSNELATSATNTGTLTGRTFAWQSLIDRAFDEGPSTVIFGSPFGTGWDRLNADGLLETFTPHNGYVVVFLRLGVLGLGGLVILLVSRLRAALRAGDYTAATWLVMIAVYHLFYHFNWLLAVTFAVALFARRDAEARRLEDEPAVQSASSPSSLAR